VRKTKFKCPRFNIDCPHKISAIKNTCFIIVSYDNIHSKKIESYLMEASKKALRLKPVVARKIKQTSSADLYCTKVCKPIQEATACIIDLTYNNTNVGFEYGFAQTLGKPIIHTKFITDVPHLKPSEEKILKEIKRRGSIQYTVLPYRPPADFSGVVRVEYKNKNDLISQLKSDFKISK